MWTWFAGLLGAVAACGWYVARAAPAERLPAAAVAPAEASRKPPEGQRHEVVIRKPAGPPRVALGGVNEKGEPLVVDCAVCHTTKPANAAATLGTPLATFHQHVSGKHGNLTCASCHHPADGYSSLRLADGRKVAYEEVMTLCAQCHGPQFRDYEHGAHGGMSGHWDLQAGGRVRNNCVDCHAPHAPKFPGMMPAPATIDRLPNGAGHD